MTVVPGMLLQFQFMLLGYSSCSASSLTMALPNSQALANASQYVHVIHYCAHIYSSCLQFCTFRNTSCILFYLHLLSEEVLISAFHELTNTDEQAQLKDYLQARRSLKWHPNDLNRTKYVTLHNNILPIMKRLEITYLNRLREAISIKDRNDFNAKRKYCAYFQQKIKN